MAEISEAQPFKYLYLGQPPNQPRSTNFEPKNWRKPVKIGKAEIVSPLGGVESEKPLNEELLGLYDVKKDIERTVEAGEVIIAAKPFVKVPCTR